MIIAWIEEQVLSMVILVYEKRQDIRIHRIMAQNVGKKLREIHTLIEKSIVNYHANVRFFLTFILLTVPLHQYFAAFFDLNEPKKKETKDIFFKLIAIVN